MKLRSIEHLISATRPEQLPNDGLPEIAFSGRSNVGKSSLINTLVDCKGLARISKTPGKTRLLNYYTVNRRFHLVDLPGYGYAKVPLRQRRAWAELVEPYLETRQTLMGIVQLIDCRHAPTELDRQMLEWLQSHDHPFIVAVTKSDKVPQSKLQERLEGVQSLLQGPENASVVLFSAKTKAGSGAIWRWIDQVIA